MTVIPRVLTLAGSALLVATLAAAQPRPQTQPPLPQDPTPVPAPKPEVEKPRPDPQTPAPAGRLGHSELVLSGCLQLSQAGRPDSSSAAAESSPIDSGYLLRGALPVSKDGTRETTGSRGKDYRIVASRESVKLADFIGHQVKVTGRVNVQRESAARTTTESGRSTSQPSGSTGVSTMPAATSPPAPLVTLTVSSVESLATTCTIPAS